MKRTPLKRSPMRRRPKSITAAERRAYAEATERARTVDGFLVCSHCAGSIPEGREHRHHVTLRSQGGKTVVSNLAIVHADCHEAIHAHRKEGDEELTRRGT